jgi:hypothetical protein
MQELQAKNCLEFPLLRVALFLGASKVEQTGAACIINIHVSTALQVCVAVLPRLKSVPTQRLESKARMNYAALKPKSEAAG